MTLPRDRRNNGRVGTHPGASATHTINSNT